MNTNYRALQKEEQRMQRIPTTKEIEDEMRAKGEVPYTDILRILKGKVANPFVSSKKKVMILDALRRQIDFHSETRVHKSNWYEVFVELNNELKALAMSDDAYEEE